MSNSRALRSVIIVCALLATGASSPKHEKLTALAADDAVVSAVKAQNARETELLALKILDSRWFVGKESVLGRQTIKNPCADRMRAFLAANPSHDEAFVLDAQGAVVCAAARTLNYWYGEQPRWQKAIGGAAFKGEDGVVSVPVMFEGKAIGVLTTKSP